MINDSMHNMCGGRMVFGKNVDNTTKFCLNQCGCVLPTLYYGRFWLYVLFQTLDTTDFFISQCLGVKMHENTVVDACEQYYKAILSLLRQQPLPALTTRDKKDEKKNCPHKLLTAFIGLACDYILCRLNLFAFIHLFPKCLI